MKAGTCIRFALASATALGVAHNSIAAEQDAPAAPSAPARSMLSEIPDPELAAMRGRFVIGNNTVAYFGVTMASSWTTGSGQELNGSVVLGMHFGPGAQTPVITFTPTMNIVQGTPLPGTSPDGVTRSIDGSGLANVNGLVQGIQIAGDGNHVINVTALRVREGTDDGNAGVTVPTSGPYDGQMTSGEGRVGVTFDPAKGVSVTLGVDSQGLVTQWIRSGSVGQLVQLTADGQSVDNQLRLDLVLGGTAATSQALRAASQALLQARMAGGAGG